jgi:hypothetical protein
VPTVGERLVADRLGHAKVDDLGDRAAVLQRDQHVGGLEIAVDDSFVVRVFHGLADGNEQRHSLPRGKMALVAVLRDRDTLDQLHHEVGPSAVGRTCIVDLGDVRMVHQGQGLPFHLEPGDHLAGIHPRLDDLESHSAADGPILRGQEHRAEAPLADLLEQPVGTDPGTRPFGSGIGFARGIVPGAAQKPACPAVGAEQVLQLRTQRRIAGGGMFQVGLELLGRPLVERAEEELAQGRIAVAHGNRPLRSCHYTVPPFETQCATGE